MKCIFGHNFIYFNKKEYVRTAIGKNLVLFSKRKCENCDIEEELQNIDSDGKEFWLRVK